MYEKTADNICGNVHFTGRLIFFVFVSLSVMNRPVTIQGSAL
jgi:hypothetical protein